MSVSLRNRYWQRREQGWLGTPIDEALGNEALDTEALG